MSKEGKQSIEKKRGDFSMPSIENVTTGNKIVGTVEEARRLGREKAKESAKKLKLRIKV